MCMLEFFLSSYKLFHSTVKQPYSKSLTILFGGVDKRHLKCSTTKKVVLYSNVVILKVEERTADTKSLPVALFNFFFFFAFVMLLKTFLICLVPR